MSALSVLMARAGLASFKQCPSPSFWVLPSAMPAAALGFHCCGLHGARLVAGLLKVRIPLPLRKLSGTFSLLWEDTCHELYSPSVDSDSVVI